MSEIVSFGEWVQTRRNLLHFSRNEFAHLVGCAPITIKKIEKDERKPSVEMAELIALHLRIPEEEKQKFVQRARGEYVPRFRAPTEIPLDDSSSPQTNFRPNKQQILGRLSPLPDQKLFGVENNIGSLSAHLKGESRPWIVAIDGLGGIGKTTLAHTLVNRFVDDDSFDDIGWVSAKQQEFSGRGIRAITPDFPALDEDGLVTALLAQLATGPYPTENLYAKRTALKEILAEKRCLVVVDNLETVTDHEALLPLLRQLANPSKFLLTTRVSLSYLSDVTCESLSELSWGDAKALLQHEAQLQQLPQLLRASEATLREIYQTAGGNPLALKLVIGQTRFLPIQQVLAGLRLAQTRQTDQLYHYIYREAWEMLDEKARKLFVSLPIVPNGTFDQLAVASQLSQFDVHSALSDLIDLSLVEVGPGDTGPRYKLHRLTETFLMHEVIKWQAHDDGMSSERRFFKDQIGVMVGHWQKDKAITDDDIEVLDQEKDGILKAIHLALSIPESWEASKSLILALTRYMERRGHWQEWQKTIETAVEMARLVEDKDGEIRMLGLLGRILIRQSKTDEVIQNYRKVIRLARTTNNEVEEARACSNLGYTLIEKEQFWSSEVMCCHALDIFEKLDHQHGLAHTNNHLGLLHLKRKNWEQAQGYFQSAIEYWQRLNDSNGLQFGFSNLGFLYNETNAPEKALPYFNKCLKILQNSGDQTGIGSIYLNLSNSHEKLLDHVLALDYAEKAELIFKQQNNILLLANTWVVIGKIKNQTNDPVIAIHYFESALNSYLTLNIKESQAEVESMLLITYLEQQQWDQAS
ncbi:MAG: tetratricopeptide repeat protein, partial [Chloroflexota bacterium]